MLIDYIGDIVAQMHPSISVNIHALISYPKVKAARAVLVPVSKQQAVMDLTCCHKTKLHK